MLDHVVRHDSGGHVSWAASTAIPVRCTSQRPCPPGPGRQQFSHNTDLNQYMFRTCGRRKEKCRASSDPNHMLWKRVLVAPCTRGAAFLPRHRCHRRLLWYGRPGVDIGPCRSMASWTHPHSLLRTPRGEACSNLVPQSAHARWGKSSCTPGLPQRVESLVSPPGSAL